MAPGYDRMNNRPQTNNDITPQQIRTIIKEGGKTLVDTAEILGEQLVNDRLTTSKIRNIYGAVKLMEINGFNANEFILLKPKLAYAAARAPEANRLKRVLTMAIDEVGNEKQYFDRFVDFFEAILAYHKAAGGK